MINELSSTFEVTWELFAQAEGDSSDFLPSEDPLVLQLVDYLLDRCSFFG